MIEGIAELRYNQSRKKTAFVEHLLGQFRRVRLRFRNHVAFRADPVFYRVEKDLISINTFASVHHEIAHMVEMSTPERWIQNDWGFPINCNGHSGKALFRAVCREVRVSAIQNHVGHRVKLMDHPVWQQVIYGLAYHSGTFQYGFEKHPAELRWQTRKEAEEWHDAYHERIYQQWSRDRIEHEWKRRIKYIRDWQETK